MPVCESLSCMLTFSLAALNFPDYSFCTKRFLSAAAVVTIPCVMFSLSLFIDLEGGSH